MRFDLPTIDDDTKAFWDATSEGRLLIRHCNSCGVHHYYPRPFCPECWSEDVAWVEASGRATLYTHSMVYVNDLPPFNEQLPYIAAVVDLEEGPRMMTRVVDCDTDDLQIGMPLEVVFETVSSAGDEPPEAAAAGGPAGAKGESGPPPEGDVVLAYFRPA